MARHVLFVLYMTGKPPRIRARLNYRSVPYYNKKLNWSGAVADTDYITEAPLLQFP